MEKLSMCRICLVKDVRLHCLVNTHLQEIYEFLSGTLLETKDTRPLHACYMCYARLHNCLRLRTTCLHSEELFSHLLENDSWEVMRSQSMNMLQITPVAHMNVSPAVHKEIKMEPSPMTDEQQKEEYVGDMQNNIKNKEICTQFIKQEDLKSEIVSSENEALDYSIQNIKVESNSASDNPYVGVGGEKGCISKSNQSNSSVDSQDILGGKTVKIVLDRIDLNSIPNSATVTEHLNSTDVEYTSESNNLNHSENEEILKPNICEKQIVHTSSEIHRSTNNDSFKHISTPTGDTINKCHICEKSFSKKSLVNLHIRRTHSDKKHKCDRCEKSFRQKCQLIVHIQSHTGEKPFRCPTCDKGFSNPSSLTIHIRTHTGEKPYKCDTCGKGFNQIGNLSYHIRMHTGEKPFQCPTCDKCFSQISNLTIHTRTHSGEKPYKCDTCGKSFSLLSNLSQHIRTHTGEKPFQCPTCNKSFRQISNLKIHIHTHTGEKPYKCDICGKGFNQISNLSHHTHIHTGKKPYKCDTCGKCFSQGSSLKKHIRTHKSIQVILQDVNEGSDL